jgi:hypothetical protein
VSESDIDPEDEILIEGHRTTADEEEWDDEDEDVEPSEPTASEKRSVTAEPPADPQSR